jgi:hypothetical protein
VLVGVAIRVAYVVISSGHTPVNDELEYHREAIFIAQGKWFWSTVPLVARPREQRPSQTRCRLLACSNVPAPATRRRTRRSARATEGGEIAAAVP